MTRAAGRVVVAAVAVLVLAPAATAASVPPGRTDPGSMMTVYEFANLYGHKAWGTKITCSRQPVEYPSGDTLVATVPSGPYRTKAVPGGSQRTYGCAPDTPKLSPIPVQLVYGATHRFLFAVVGYPGYVPYCHITPLRTGYHVSCTTSTPGRAAVATIP